MFNVLVLSAMDLQVPIRLSVVPPTDNQDDLLSTDRDRTRTTFPPKSPTIGRKLFLILFYFGTQSPTFISVLLFVLVFNVLEVYDHVQRKTPTPSNPKENQKKKQK